MHELVLTMVHALMQKEQHGVGMGACIAAGTDTCIASDADICMTVAW